MRVITLVGTRAGEIVDLPVPVARAMLADGRARPIGVLTEPDDVPLAADPAHRQDRVPPHAKQRRRR